MNPTEDVAIVGGGPAGAYCALELSKKGVYPVILDHSHPREKPCGGGLSPSVIQRFPLLEKFRSQGFTFGSFKLISCTNNQAVYKGLENGFCISRRVLDEGLLNFATESGARLAKEKVIDVRKVGRLWKIKTNKGLRSSGILVGADGVSSIVRRETVGPISRENLGLACGYLTTQVEKEYAAIKFLGEIPGYIWVFPGRNYSNIGIGSELKYGNRLKPLLDDFIHSYCPAVRINSKYAAMLPSASNPEFFQLQCAGENWILVGDAAGHVDPIGGGGIIYALWGGKLAAEAIFRNDPKAYDKLWREEYGNYLKERAKNKYAFYDPVNSTLSMLLGLANKTYLWSTA